MSYCRFSSDNWWSDVYVYQSAGGWITHVAGMRGVIRPVPDIISCSFSAWLCGRGGAAYKAWIRFALLWQRFLHRPSLRLIPMRPIGLPHDGETFTADTPSECADTLECLRSLGYRVPQRAIDALREEAGE